MARELKDNYVIKDFIDCFRTSPTIFVKAPGRVNLIGEHTDYNGLPVMPVAIPYTITVAASPREDGKVVIRNTDFRYGTAEFEISDNIPHSEPGDWANYVKAAANELSSRLSFDFRGMNALFHGDIPSSAGLSSSSALVVASALAVLAVNDRSMDYIELAEAMAHGEHYVGTQGGGMDQAVCLFGKKGKAVKIDFFPLGYRYVPFPGDHSLVVAHSLVRAAKTENALLMYNRRPAECRLATAVVNALHGPEPLLERLGDVKKSGFFGNFGDAVSFVEATFPKEAYSLAEIAEITGENEETLTGKYLMTCSGVPMPQPPDGFLLRQRALHVLTEADRVEESAGALERGDVPAFGKLMDESHESCDVNYGLSTPELNELVAVMRESGALGARLTGAGFGGCAIGLVGDDDIQPVLDGIRSRYYDTYIKKNRPDLYDRFDESLLFVIKPSEGAVVTRI